MSGRRWLRRVSGRPGLPTYGLGKERRLCRPRDCADVDAGCLEGQGFRAREVGTIQLLGLILALLIPEKDEQRSAAAAKVLRRFLAEPLAAYLAKVESRLFEQPSDCADLLGLLALLDGGFLREVGTIVRSAQSSCSGWSLLC